MSQLLGLQAFFWMGTRFVALVHAPGLSLTGIYEYVVVQQH